MGAWGCAAALIAGLGVCLAPSPPCGLASPTTWSPGPHTIQSEHSCPWDTRTGPGWTLGEQAQLCVDRPSPAGGGAGPGRSQGSACVAAGAPWRGSPEKPGPSGAFIQKHPPENGANREAGKTQEGRDQCLPVLELLDPNVPEVGPVSQHSQLDEPMKGLLC